MRCWPRDWTGVCGGSDGQSQRLRLAVSNRTDSTSLHSATQAPVQQHWGGSIEFSLERTQGGEPLVNGLVQTLSVFFPFLGGVRRPVCFVAGHVPSVPSPVCWRSWSGSADHWVATCQC